MISLANSPSAAFPAIPGLEILKELDRGGMSVVFLARQTGLNRHVCVKVLSDIDEESPESRRARFTREAELLASVVHPHVLSIFDFGVFQDSGLPFLVTEYIEGGNLRRYIPEARPMPADEALSLLDQIGQALEHLHGKGILHRDLKPENVLMPTSSLCKVGDFGLAVRADRAGQLTQSLRGLGTAGYASPEQQYGLKVSERSDQFSLAALAYELLTGKRPLGRLVPPSQVNRGLPGRVDRVILRGLADEPEDRYPTVREFLDDLKGALKHPARWRRPRLLAFGGLAALVLTVGAAFILSSWRDDPGRMPPGQAVVPEGGSADGAGRSGPRPETKAEPPEAPAAPSERSPAHSRLVQLRAYRLWVDQGSPKGKRGDEVRERNWHDAEVQIDAEVDRRAFQYWEEQGSPQGAEGEAVREPNRRRAEEALLRETEEELRRPPPRTDRSP